ncbi:MAG: hypothetical protein WC734_02135 [Patescibacteria group bacterium]|jgi:hypothetical protein
MKLKIGLLLLALGCGVGLWYWAQHQNPTDSQIKGVQTDSRSQQSSGLGLVWLINSPTGGRLATMGADNQPRLLTPETKDIKLACRMNDTQYAYFDETDGFNKLWLGSVTQAEPTFIMATRQEPVEIICDRLGNHLMYTTFDSDRQILNQVDLATRTSRSVDTVTGRAAYDQTGQRMIYPMSDGLYYREINRTGELSESLQVVAGTVESAIFSQSNNAVIYVAQENNGYVLYQTDWRSQTTSQLSRFDIELGELEWSLSLSNDGEVILYRFAPKQSTWQSTIGSIRADGTSQQTLQEGVGRAAWMPGEPVVVYEKLRLSSGDIAVDLWQMTAQGSNREIIVGTGQNYLTGYRAVDPSSSESAQ